MAENSDAALIKAVTVTTLAMVWVFMALRLYVRLFLIKAPRSDDAAAMAALVRPE
jgi:hypothetical protein